VGATTAVIGEMRDPCTNRDRILRAALGGAFNGAVVAIVPFGVIGGLAGRVAIGAFGSELGNIGQQLIVDGSVNWSQVQTQMAFGAMGGFVANYAGLGSALLSLDRGLSAPVAVELSEGVGLGTSMLFGTVANDGVSNERGGYAGPQD
jgi:hypothetical protein